MIFTIPIPPSVNNLYGHNRKGITYIKAKGKAWFEEAGWIIKSQVGDYDTFLGDCDIDISLYTCIPRDVDNINKATLDLTAKHLRIVDNDDQYIDLHVHKYRVPHRADERLEVGVKESKL